MPELPEVEAARQLVENHCLNKKIEGATVAADDKVIEGISSEDLQALLSGKHIKTARRKGKHLWLTFDRGPAVMFHFGMTGSMVVRGVAAARYKTFIVDEEEWPPRFWKVQIDLADDVHLAFTDARRFARVRVQEDPESQPPVNALGFDPLLSMPSLEEFRGMLAEQQRQIKVVLMDQSFSAGVGNWVADEVLFQARIHPEDRTNGLDAQQQEQLHHWLHEVPRVACEVGAASDKFPTSWLFKHRWTQKGKPAVEGGHAIEFSTVGGRTTAIVPDFQKRTTSEPAKKGSKPASRAKEKAKDTKVKSKQKSSSSDEEGQDDSESESAEEDSDSSARPARGRAGKAAATAGPKQTGRQKAKPGGRSAAMQQGRNKKRKADDDGTDNTAEDIPARQPKTKARAVAPKSRKATGRGTSKRKQNTGTSAAVEEDQPAEKPAKKSKKPQPSAQGWGRSRA